MRGFDGWLIELDSARVSPRYLAANGNEDVFWTSNPYQAKRFTTESAAARFRDQHIDGAATARRHFW